MTINPTLGNTMDPYATINGIHLTKQEFFDLMRLLVEDAIRIAPTAGDHTESGLVYHFFDDRNMI